MPRRSNTAARFLAAIAVCLQIFMPAALLSAESHGSDLPQYLCSAPGSPTSTQSAAAALELAELFGEPDQSGLHTNGHCPLCTLVHGMPLPSPLVLDAPASHAVETPPVLHPTDVISRFQGPPLGSRGPPTHS